MKTRNGIYYDLNESVYKHHSKEMGLTFVFSSDLYLCKFEEQFKLHRKDFNLKHSVRFKINVNFKVLPDIILYSKIEKRGFLILSERGQALCQNDLILNGERVTLKS